MVLRFEPVEWPADGPEVIDFLVASEWPCHGVARLGPGDAARVTVAGDAIESFWVVDDEADGHAIGLVRLLDLDDVGSGSPVFDLRLAENIADAVSVGTRCAGSRTTLSRRPDAPSHRGDDLR